MVRVRLEDGLHFGCRTGWAFVVALLIAGCGTGGNKVGTPVSNGKFKMTVVSADRRNALPGVTAANPLDALLLTVEMDEHHLADDFVRQSTVRLTDASGKAHEVKDRGVDKAKQRAYFVFIVPKESKGLKFTFADFPAVSLD